MLNCFFPQKYPPGEYSHSVALLLGFVVLMFYRFSKFLKSYGKISCSMLPFGTRNAFGKPLSLGKDTSEKYCCHSDLFRTCYADTCANINVKRSYQKSGYVDEEESGKDGSNYERKPLKKVNENEFIVAQFNTLASQLSYPGSFPFVNSEYLKWGHRKALLTKEIQSHCIDNFADIICLEEVDDPEFFIDLFGKQYSSFSIFRDMSMKDEMGVMLLWNNKRFKSLKKEKFFYKELRQTGLIVLLEEKTTGRKILVGGTHLKSKVGNEEIRKKEIDEMVARLGVAQRTWLKKKETVPVILLGDLNETPFLKSEVTSVYKSLVETAGFISSYGNYAEAPTTFKKRETGEKLRTIDYIFFQDNGLIEKKGILELPDWKQFREVFPQRLPSKFYGSDHILISSKFEFVLKDKK